MAKVSSFMIGIVVIGLVIALLNIFLAGVSSAYPTTTFNNQTLQAYNKMNDIATQTNTLKEEVTGINENPNALDVIGGYFTAGYDAIRTVIKSFDAFDAMVNTGISDANLGAAGYYLKIAIGTIIWILLIVGVAISAILKKDV